MKEISQLSEVPNSGTALLYFGATWCGPCRMLRPVVEQISKEKPDFDILKVDVDEAKEIADEYNVRGIPALVMITDGVEVARKTGYTTKIVIENFIAEAQF